MTTYRTKPVPPELAQLGTRVRTARLQADVSQGALALAIGERYAGTICRLERGQRRRIRTDAIVLLAQALHVSTDYLLGLSELPNAAAHLAAQAARIHELEQHVAALAGQTSAPLLSQKEMFDA